MIFLARAIQHVCLHPPGYGRMQGAAAMPQDLAMKDDLSHTMTLWRKGQLILQPTEEPAVTLSTPELTRAELYLVFSVKQKWSYRKLQYCMLRFTHTLGCIATRQLTANALCELDYL